MCSTELARLTRDNAIRSARLLRAYANAVEAVASCVRIARAQNRELVRLLRIA